jgi:hypothetical protein
MHATNWTDRRGLIRLVLVTLCATFAAGRGAADEVPGQTLKWSLRDEFRTGTSRENPNGDRTNELVWYWQRTTSSDGPVESRKWRSTTTAISAVLFGAAVQATGALNADSQTCSGPTHRRGLEYRWLGQ